MFDPRPHSQVSVRWIRWHFVIFRSAFVLLYAGVKRCSCHISSTTKTLARSCHTVCFGEAGLLYCWFFCPHWAVGSSLFLNSGLHRCFQRSSCRKVRTQWGVEATPLSGSCSLCVNLRCGSLGGFYFFSLFFFLNNRSPPPPPADDVLPVVQPFLCINSPVLTLHPWHVCALCTVPYTFIMPELRT